VRSATLEDAGLPIVFTTEEATAAGFGRHRVAGMVRRGAWVRLRAGTYCRGPLWAEADARLRFTLRSIAAQRCRTGATVSHLSAAALWQWPMPLDHARAVWLTVASGGAACTRQRDDLRVEVAALPLADVVTTTATRATSRARTAADCLRHLPAQDAVAIADAAGREGLSRQRLDEVLRRQARWPYADAARTALSLVDPRRESWLEPWSVVRLHARGVPLPEPQAHVEDARGRFVARVDWWWPDLGVVGEADGREKYRRQGLRTPDDAERQLRDEKEREDRLRDAGLEVVRYGTRDAVQLDDLVARWHRAAERGDPGRLRGRITPAPWPRGWAPRVPRMPLLRTG